ncbi:hypothetical protein [Neorhizobium tomejilense]|uniref:hypothetical protein n=1 Tax=Neorhizobium tomejilense TaxID=2093828 RepID=UPI003ED01504
MKLEDIAQLRTDYPEIMTSSTGIEDTMPDIWLASIKRCLSELRRIKEGSLFPDTPAVDLHVRGIRSVHRRFRASGHPTVGFEVHAPTARGRGQQAIMGALAHAQYACGEAEKEELGRQRAAQINADVAHYVEQCLIGRRIVDFRHVVFSSVDDSEWTQTAYVDLVIRRVQAFAKGADFEGLDETARSRFLGIYKAQG